MSEIAESGSRPTFSIAHFDFSDLHSAPKGPGIYAWYAKLPAGAADWKRILDEATGEDLGEKRLRELILLHCHKFNPPAFDVTAISSYEVEWSGRLEPQLAASLEAVLRPDAESSPDNEAYRAFKNVLKKEKSRAALVELISKASPVFSAPIYVGTSKHIRKRLLEHADRIRKFAAAIAAEPDERAEIVKYLKSEKGKSDFAARITAMEFAPEQLEVYTMDVTNLAYAAHSTDDFAALAATLEWLLNRWHRPIAGRP